MAKIAKIVGERIRNHRSHQGLSQEQLAEKCNLHTTYIGQLERGEKNATLESIEKVTRGLNIRLDTLFEDIVTGESDKSVASQCYSLVDALDRKEQEIIYDILKKIVLYKNM